MKFSLERIGSRNRNAIGLSEVFEVINIAPRGGIRGAWHEFNLICRNCGCTFGFSLSFFHFPPTRRTFVIKARLNETPEPCEQN